MMQVKKKVGRLQNQPKTERVKDDGESECFNVMLEIVVMQRVERLPTSIRSKMTKNLQGNSIKFN